MDKTLEVLKARMKENVQFEKSPGIASYKKISLWIKFHPYRFFAVLVLLFLAVSVIFSIDLTRIVNILQFGF
jgi:hypothetical protein